jgi:WD40-like Beta Propeller Repeat
MRVGRSGAIRTACLSLLASLGLQCTEDVRIVGRSSADLGAASDAAALQPLGSFSPPRIIAELSDPDTEETEPTLTEDELEIYFASTRNPGRRQIFVATRTSSSDRWTVPTLVDAFVSDTGITYSPEISRDGLTLWFVSDRPGGRGDVDIYVSTRIARGAAWSTPANVPELNTQTCEIDPGPLPEYNQMIVTRCDSIGHNHMNLTQRSGPAAPWDPAASLDQLNTDQKEGDPVFAGDGLVVYFATTRDSPNHDNRADIWRASRTSVGAAFQAPVPVKELNILEVDDQDPWVSNDERHIVFTSARDRWPREIYESFR